jgi:hypothetical protein
VHTPQKTAGWVLRWEPHYLAYMKNQPAVMTMICQGVVAIKLLIYTSMHVHVCKWELITFKTELHHECFDKHKLSVHKTDCILCQEDRNTPAMKVNSKHYVFSIFSIKNCKMGLLVPPCLSALTILESLNGFP